jgi:hypothetical protein
MWLSVPRTVIQTDLRLGINALMTPVDLRLNINILAIYWPENENWLTGVQTYTPSIIGKGGVFSENLYDPLHKTEVFTLI